MKNIYINSEIYNDRSRQWKTMSLQKFKKEICICVMLTDICTNILNDRINPKYFTIELNKYIELLKCLKFKHKNLYRVILNIQNNLNEYFIRVTTGYCLKQINSYSQSYYSITDKLDNIIGQMIINKTFYYEYDCEKILTGCYLNKLYEYKGILYNSYNDITKTIDIKFGEYNNVLKDIKNNTNELYILKTGLDTAKTTIIDNFVYKKLYTKHKCDACIQHTSKVSLSALQNIKNNEILYKNNKSILHIVNTILLNMYKDGSYTQKYFRGAHGRLYQHGYNLQMLNKEYRDIILNEYQDVDIKAATFSILWNYARENDIHDSKMPTLYSYTQDPDNFRNDILNKLKISDPYVTIKYVKDVLNAIAFGAKFNESRIISDIINGTNYSIPVLTKGYSSKITPINIVNLNEVKNLVSEIKYITDKLVQKLTNNGELYNCIGLKYDKKVKTQYGKKLSHLYQGAEVRVLETIINYELEGKKLIDIPYAIGLLLHDGIYIKKNVLKQINQNLPLDLYIEKKLGYSLKFS